MSEEELKNKMDTFIECYKNGMIFGAPTDIEFYEKIATLQQKVEQLENIIKEAIDFLDNVSIDDIEGVIYLNLGGSVKKYLDFKEDLLNILNKGSDKK